MEIHSIKDPRIVHARQLSTSKGRLEAQEFLLEGHEQIRWGIETALTITIVFIHDKLHDHPLLKEFERLKISYYFVSDGILKKITDTNYLVAMIGVAKNPEIKNDEKDFVLVLDGLVDHGNIGTIVRSARAFGIHNLISSNLTTDFFYKKVIDASRGKVFETHIQKYATPQETIDYLKGNGYQIITTSPHARHVQSLVNLADNKPIALVLGNETEGCAPEFIEQADVLIQIPMSSDVESLNVAVAAGISMYELKIKLIIAMLIQKIYKNLGRQFGVTVQLIQQALDSELKKVTNLSGMQVILLMILKCDSFMSIDQVVNDIGKHEEELKNFLAPLESHGYINTTMQEGKSGITLTKSGEELIAKLWPIIDKTEEKVLHNFSPEERAQLTEYIARIQDNCNVIVSSNR